MPKPALEGKRIAILIANGFDSQELAALREAIKNAGATANLVSLDGERVKGWWNGEWQSAVEPEFKAREAQAHEYDALCIPGGILSADQLRADTDALGFVRGFIHEHKPVAILGHSVWILSDAGLAKGRTITSARSIQGDLAACGAKWVDAPVHTENGLISGRGGADLARFAQVMVDEFARGRRRFQMDSEDLQPPKPESLQTHEG